MAEALVPSLLKLIPDILKLLGEEYRLGSEAKVELEYLRDLIGAIGRFLKKADSKEVIDEDLKASMKRVRKFIYDSQDSIDDFIRRGKRSWEGLGILICDHYNRRTLSSEAKSIRKMVENYKTTLENSNSLLADHAKPNSACHRSLSIAFSMEKDHELVGIEAPRKLLVQWLTENSSTPKVIFVHGMQGVGKTSLVGTVLRDEIARSHFRYYVWIKNLRSCELVDDKAALMKANAEIWDPTDKDGLGIQLELQEVFSRLWNKNIRWALILDDVGSTHVFESLRNLLAQTHPSILVTTRDSSLASNCRTFLDSRMAQSGGAPLETAKRLFDIRHFKHVLLSSKDSSTLLCQKMFDTDACPDVFEDASDSIVKHCEGLPLAILAASKLFIDIQGGVNGTPPSVEWKKLSGRLGEALLSKGDKSGLIRRMITLRMDHLHDVRACLFYLSIFPLDCHISCSTLMRLWMAEKFIEQKGTNPLQTIAEETLKKLADHNFIQEVEKTGYERVKTCRIHNILHQIIISKSKDDEFAMIVADPEEGWPENVWRLSFHSPMDGIKDGKGVKRLRSLLVFKKVHPNSMKELLGQVNRLNVLDLQVSSLNYFPEEICSLKYLRYLGLRGTDVSKIPDHIGDLVHLETLDLKGTLVRELPASILKLKALRHLLVYRSRRRPPAGALPKEGVKAPSNLGDLRSLQKLCLIELKEDKQSTVPKIIQGEKVHLLEEVGKLENLRRLGISNLRNQDGKRLCSSIERLTKLESLHLITATRRETLNLSNVREALPFLQRIHLTGYLQTLPKWILSPSLAKLFLKGSLLNEQDPLQHFKGLPCLKHLDLQEAFDASEIKFEAGGFQQLRFLGLDTFHRLESITVRQKALPALKRLCLARCKKLTVVPQDIMLPEELKCLELYDMPEEFKTAITEDKAVCERMNVIIKVWRNEALVEVPMPSMGPPTDPSTDSPRSPQQSYACLK